MVSFRTRPHPCRLPLIRVIGPVIRLFLSPPPLLLVPDFSLLKGKRESDAVREYAAGLPHSEWRVFFHERINRPDAPALLTIYKL